MHPEMTTCQYGHPRTPANTYLYPYKDRKRPFCRPCRARNMREARVRQVEAPRDRREWRLKNRDRINASRREYYHRNKKRCSALKRIQTIIRKNNPSEGEIQQAWELRKQFPSKAVRR